MDEQGSRLRTRRQAIEILWYSSLATALAGLSLAFGRRAMSYKAPNAEVPLTLLEIYPLEQQAVIKRLLDQGDEFNDETIEKAQAILGDVDNLVEGLRMGTVAIDFYQVDAWDENSTELIKTVMIWGNVYPPPLELYIEENSDPTQRYGYASDIPFGTLIDEKDPGCFHAKGGCNDHPQSFALILYSEDQENEAITQLVPVNHVLHREGSLTTPLNATTNDVVSTEFAIREYLIKELFLPDVRNYEETSCTFD